MVNNRTHTNTSTQAGFSLVEVLIAMAVFAIAALGLASLNKISMDSSVFGRERTAAANIAQYAMTWLQNEAGAFAPEGTQANFPLLEESLNTSPGLWVPIAIGGSTVRLDDYLANSGEDHYSGGVDTVKFCVHYRVLQTNGVGGPVMPANLFYASVLITWPRDGGYVAAWKDCNQRITQNAANADVNVNMHSLRINQILTRDFSNKI